jgi:hypothetical protein
MYIVKYEKRGHSACMQFNVNDPLWGFQHCESRCHSPLATMATHYFSSSSAPWHLITIEHLAPRAMYVFYIAGDVPAYLSTLHNWHHAANSKGEALSRATIGRKIFHASHTEHPLA